MSISAQDSKAIRQRVLRSISSNRAAGFHFAGYYLGFQCQRYQPEGVAFEMSAGVHNSDADGIVNRAAVLFAADMMLAASNRAFIDPNRRTATLMLRVEFTGAPARGTLHASGRGAGFSPRTALPESTCTGQVMSEGRDVMRASGTWVSPPAPQGVVMAGLPWEGGLNGTQLPLLKSSALEPIEKDLMRRTARALRSAPNNDFLASLWNPLVKRLPNGAGASGRLPVGMHVGNRVGHVQGGLLINMALCVAEAAVPEHPLTTGASAWYISPGQGKVITARATVLQSGRNVAVVRTELFSAGRKLVLEVVSNHAVGARGVVQG